MFTRIISSLLVSFFSLNIISSQVKVIQTDGTWSFMLNNQPFEAKGVTFGYDHDVANYDAYFEELTFLGVNSIRLWATNENTRSLLDAAHRHNIKVMVGIWMRHGRPGMEDDDSFDYLNDAQGKEDMYNNALEVVAQFKEHPAVLTWGVGNEVYLNTATDEEKEAYSKLLEKVCSAIKASDPMHPITSVEAWTFGLPWWEKHVPSLDIYGINCYGPGADVLPVELKKMNITKPYVITEYGVTGEWDSQTDANGVIIEPSDERKYLEIATGYKDWIQPKPTCLGVYFFHYANGTDHLAPWLLTHVNGLKRPQFWAIRNAFTGEEPVNHPPAIENFEVPNGPFESGSWIEVNLETKDKEEDDLEISFSYNQRTGSRKRRDQILPLAHRSSGDGIEIYLPKEDGPIKVYAMVSDAENMGIATSSTVVQDADRRNVKHLVPKAQLPFYVYKDGEDNPYAASGFMGNYEAMDVELREKEEVHAGEASLMISYNARRDWYGLGLMDPANDWGDILRGYDLTGATKFTFWAKADAEVTAKIGFGLIGSDKPYPDSAKGEIEVKLSTEWKQYTIKTKKMDLSCIRTGLVLFSSSSLFPHKIYLDEVVFE